MFPMRRFKLARILLSVLAFVLVCGVAVAGPKAYVGNFKDNTVSVVDTVADAVIATIPIAAVPHGMAISPDGRWLYVSSDGSSIISVIDKSAHVITVQSVHGASEVREFAGKTR